MRSYAYLRTGDIVVHEDHGVARFAGFDTKTVSGVTRDYLDLEFQGSDRVFMPTEQLAKISRYVGAGAEHPPLSKLGGSRWEQLKARARRAAQELAGELRNLYAERRRRSGHDFPADGDWQREFEAAFPYQETPDQRDAIEAVKEDMEAPRPMDRLICGDVGYGKTEVALRAAFKAAGDGKQVLVLAPTTILAQQHFGTFSERLKDYPFTIEHASRFRTPAQQKEAIAETAERLRGLCPGVEFVVAHGQMDEKTLEARMLAFLRGEADVLVATSIIESGIDIPQANTLIVERSDVFGLAQLYQIRGRVGRSRERAYAYLLYPSHAALTEEAMKRLTALSDYTELGAGFKIAMRDLEIRGAGNLLGDEQSGHVAALGFELYLAMLEEAVAAADGGWSDEREPVRLDVNVDAYVPADYIPYEQAKIDVHRRIAAAREVSELGMLRDELEDRFGPIPEPLSNLISLQQARIKLGHAGARVVSFRGEA